MALRISLFWRTFLLIALLLLLSMALGLGLLRQLDPTPPEQNLAWELASAVNLTRNALITAQPNKRRDLLADLQREEGVRIVPLEDNDQVQAWLPAHNRQRIEEAVRKLLGAETVLATQVNQQRGLWVSFVIEGDRYWLVLPEQRLSRQKDLPVLTVLAALALFALVGTTAMSGLVNRPLANLSQAITALGEGRNPPPLREDLASEIAAVNRRFNQMTRDLGQLEADRTLALAGISHDIRTPLTRLRMEIEMAPLPEEQRQAMADDIERINQIVAQFMDYARAGRSTEREDVALSERLQAMAQRLAAPVPGSSAEDGPILSAEIEPGLHWDGNATDLDRMVGTLIENARRYGRASGDRQARVTLTARRISRGPRLPEQVQITVRDHGPGVPAEKLDSLTKPFMRLDEARGMHEGAGLGLAIVERIVTRHGGSLRLGAPALGSGLEAQLLLPLTA